ncbi:hypothetical protein JW979_16080 [bacterium]|nr:hypothetical protein [candidate division CSSED10-310 bacterium]
MNSQDKTNKQLHASRSQLLVGLLLFILTLIAAIIIYHIFSPVPEDKSNQSVIETATAQPTVHAVDLFNKEIKQSGETGNPKIIVQSDVEGAEVFYENSYLGIAPVIIENVTIGDHSGEVRISHPPSRKTFHVHVPDQTGKTYFAAVSFLGGTPAPITLPADTPESEKNFIVHYPKTVKFNTYFYIFVEPARAITFNSGRLFISAKCKLQHSALNSVIPMQMVPYKNGLIRENLKPDFCHAPEHDADNGALFYIEIETNEGVMQVGSPEDPYEINFTRH